MERLKILCVEDDDLIRSFLVQKLEKYGRVYQANNIANALKLIEQQPIDAALIDLNLESESQLDGLEIVKKATAHGIRNAVLTGHEEKEVIAKALESGADYYFSKVNLQDNFESSIGFFFQGFNTEDLEQFFKIDFITQDISLKAKISYLKDQAGHSSQAILITGPTGVGKTKIAELIHQLTKRNAPFISKNLSEINENLIESELFGHIKGAFTGATADKKGLLAQADGGTLFLDEIACLPIALQQKLLRVLEDKSFSPVGSSQIIKSDFRLVSATCEDLADKLTNGNLRVDFYFRIKGSEIDISPLKDRPGDIPILIDYFIGQSTKKILIKDEALKVLRNYDWHGNTRELKHLIEELIRGSDSIVKKESLPYHIQYNTHPLERKNCQANRPLLNPRSIAMIKEYGLPHYIKEIEKEAFLNLRDELGDKINQISRELKISKSVYYRIAGEVEYVQ